MHRALFERLTPLVSVLAFAIAPAALLGCTPAVGDRCTLSTDCSVQGNRVCDTSEPGGYCTLLGCTPNACPDNAACVEFGASVPGCAYDDYQAPSRVGRSMCMKTCGSNSDCRESDGYTCASPTAENSSTVILDTDQSRRVCMITGAAVTAVDADVCSSERTDAAPLDLSSGGDNGGDGGGQDAAGDGAGDAGQEDAGQEEAADDGADDSTDDAADATVAPPVDSGAVDAQDGG
jgi:hypothetical protein